MGREPFLKKEIFVLEALRSFVGSWVAKILLGLLVISFAVWGVAGTVFSGAASNTVASVGESEVSVVDYLAAYNRNINEISQQAGRRLTQEQARIFGVEQRTLTDVVTGATLDEYARTLNMSLSQDTLAQMIADNPAFHDASGKFNRQQFQTAVNRAGMREADFIDQQNGNAVRGQIMEAIAEGELLPDVFDKALSDYAGEKRKFAYLTITPALSGEPSAATDTDLQKWYDANSKTYKAPEYRKVEILALEPKDVVDEVIVSDEDVEREYEGRKQSFGTAEQRRVQQLVLSEEKAKQAKLDLAGGATFETILAENNIKPSDADLGLVVRSRLPKALQEPAFSLRLNNVSEIIDGPFGPTLLRVIEIQPASQKTLAEVADQLRKELALHQAGDQVIELQTSIEDARAGGATLAEAADRFKLKTRTIDAIDQTARDKDGNIISDLPASRELIAEVFKTEVGEQTSPLDLNSIGSLWYEVVDVLPARDRPLDEVKDRVRTDWRAAEQAKLVEQKAEALKKRLEDGATLASLATELGVEMQETGLLTRTGRETSFPSAAVSAGFAGTAKESAIADAATAGDKLLITVMDTEVPGSEISDAAKQEIERANLGAANDLLEQLISKLQSQYPVNYNPTLMQQALARR